MDGASMEHPTDTSPVNLDGGGKPFHKPYGDRVMKRLDYIDEVEKKQQDFLYAMKRSIVNELEPDDDVINRVLWECPE